MKKKMAALAVSLAFIMTASAGALAEACDCQTGSGDCGEGWSALESATPASGKYCLGKGGFSGETIKINHGQAVTICLHGQTIDTVIENRGDMTLTDCRGGGTLNGRIKNFKGNSVSGSMTGWTVNGSVQNENKVFTMNDCTVNGGVSNMSQCTLIMNNCTVNGSISNYYNSTLTLNGGSVTTTGRSDSLYAVSNEGTLHLKNGASVSALPSQKEWKVYGIYNWMGDIIIDNASVSSERYYAIGALSIKNCSLTIYEGTLSSGGKYETVGEDDEDDAPKTEEEAVAKYVAQGSYKSDGDFLGQNVAVKKVPAEIDPPQDDGAGNLPKTGDPSMLGAWAVLLSASAAALRMRRKR